jgi:hypothetical protein
VPPAPGTGIPRFQAVPRTFHKPLHNSLDSFQMIILTDINEQRVSQLSCLRTRYGGIGNCFRKNRVGGQPPLDCA